MRYRMIVRYKTAYYTFYLPCAIGMIYAGVKDPSSYRLARDICCRIGEFFQIQDDYLDCFGDPEVIGKVCVVLGSSTEGRLSQEAFLDVPAVLRGACCKRSDFETHARLDSTSGVVDRTLTIFLRTTEAQIEACF